MPFSKECLAPLPFPLLLCADASTTQNNQIIDGVPIIAMIFFVQKLLEEKTLWLFEVVEPAIEIQQLAYCLFLGVLGLVNSLIILQL